MRTTLFFIILFAATTGLSQFDRGLITLGGNGQGGLGFNSNRMEYASLLVSPKVGYFMAKNLELVSTNHIGYSSFLVGTNRENRFGFYTDLTLRYRFNFGSVREKDGHTWKPFSVCPIVGAGATRDIFKSPSRSYLIKAGVGSSVMITRNLSIDAEVLYERSAGSTPGGLRMPIGITYYFR